ncbi:MAG: fibronectin type III domain-containing protein [Elusimicrobia bacterium]|nr:fibronectin type III domain-containing protein [Elusimicrobiota bacterium]
MKNKKIIKIGTLPRIFIVRGISILLLYLITIFYSNFACADNIIHTTTTDFSSGTFTGWGITASTSSDLRLDFEASGIESTGTTTSLTLNRVFHAVATWNGRIYVSGGGDGAAESTVYSAQINPNGTISSWNTEINSLPQARYYHAMVAWNGRLYVTGGKNGGTTVNTVYSASISTNGSIGSWTIEANVLPAVRHSHAMSAWNGRLYVTGGDDGSGGDAPQTTVYSAPINANGSVGNWKVEPNALQSARYGHTMGIWNNKIYVVGGWGATYSDLVFSASINFDGTVGVWSQETKQLPIAFKYHAMSVYNGVLYVSGGYSGSGVLDTIFIASITANGNVGTWSSVTALPGKRCYHSMGAWNGTLYVIGGQDETFANKSTVFMIAVKSQSIFKESWVTESNNLSQGLSGLAMATYNGRLYVVGGFNSGISTPSVYSSLIDGNGNVGSWTNEANQMPQGRYNHAAAVWNGKLYVAGGLSSNTVYSAPINGDGSIGVWGAQGNTLPQNLDYHTMVAWGSSLYVVGGINGGTPQNTVYRSSVSGNGTVGVWNVETALPKALYGHAMSIYNGKLYVAGGEDFSFTISSCVYTAPINGDATVGSWTQEPFSLPSGGAKYLSMCIDNNKIVVTGGNNSGAKNTVYSSTITANGGVGVWTVEPKTLPLQLDSHAMTTYNGRFYLAGGANSGGVPQPQVYSNSMNEWRLYTTSGTYFSPVIDFGNTDIINSISWTQSNNPAGSVVAVWIATATSGTQVISTFTQVSNGNALNISARYLQYRIDMSPGGIIGTPPREQTPIIDDVTISYTSVLLPAPTLYYPSTATWTNAGICDWSDVTGAAEYNLQIDDDINFGSINQNSNATQSSATITSLSENLLYYWRVKTKNSDGNYGAWSSTRSFKLDLTDAVFSNLLVQTSTGGWAASTSYVNISTPQIQINVQDVNYSGLRVGMTETVASSGCVLLMHLNGDTTDYSGYGNDGARVGTSWSSIPTWKTTGGNENMLYFNGTADYVNCVNGEGLTNLINKITVSAWINWTKPSDADQQIAVGRSGDWRFGDMGASNNTWGFYAPAPYNGTGGWAPSGVTVPQNEWHHMVFTYNGSTAKIYKDGILAKQASVTGNLGINNNVFIGARNNANSYFGGYIDEVGIWERTLSAEEIAVMYNSCAVKYSTNAWTNSEIITSTNIVRTTGIDGTTSLQFSTATAIQFKQGTDNRIQFLARDEAGNLAESASYTINIDTITLPPAAISDLTALPGNNEGEIVLKWTAPGADGTVGNLTGQFEIKYSTVGIITAGNYDTPPVTTYIVDITTSNVAPLTICTTTFYNLSPNTTYWFAIKAKDEAGNWSLWSSQQDFATINTKAYIYIPSIIMAVNSGVWNDQNTWEGSNVPSPYQRVQINGGRIVTFNRNDSNVTCSTITIIGKLQFDAGVDSRTMIVAGGIDIQSGGQFLMPPNTGYISVLKIKCNSAGEYGITVNNGGVFDVQGNTTTTPSNRNCLITSYNSSYKTYIRNLSQAEANFNMYYVEVSSLGMSDIGKYGITFDGSGTKGKVNYCSIHNGYYGIYLYYSSNNTLDNNSCYSNSQGIFVQASSNNTLSNNSCYSNTSDGIYLSDGSNNNTIVNNNCYLNSRHGISLYNSSTNNIVNSNSCYSNTQNGIYFENSSNNNILSNNSCYSTIRGIRVKSSINNTVVNCELGKSGNNVSGDIDYSGSSLLTLTLKDCSLNSTTKVNTTGMTAAGSYLVSYNQDNSTGTVKIWGDYQVDSGKTLKSNYDDVLYVSTATEPNATLKGTGSIYGIKTNDYQTATELWEVKCTGDPNFTVKRGTSSVLYTDDPGNVLDNGVEYTSNIRGVKFTIQSDVYSVGDMFYFVTVSSSADSFVQKKIEFNDSPVGTKLTVSTGGEIQMRGSLLYPTISTSAASNVYYGFYSSGTTNLNSYVFSNLTSNGVVISSGANVIDLSTGTFNSIQDSAGDSSYIRVNGLTSSATFYGNIFNDALGTADYNVKANGSGINWTFMNASGAKSGESYDNEVNGAIITWKENVPPTIQNLQSGDNVVRNVAGATYKVYFYDDGGSGLDTIQYKACSQPGQVGIIKDWTNITAPLGGSATYYQTDWNLDADFNTLLSFPTTNWISVRAWDVSGNTTTIPDVFYVIKDTIPPASGVSYPSETNYETLSTISGTAGDNYNLNKVVLQIKRWSDNQYWTGSGWNGDSTTWLNTTGSPIVWQYNGLTDANLTPGCSYWVVSRASDTVGNLETSGAGITFTYKWKKTIGSGNWDVAGMWFGGQTPLAGDAVEIRSNHAITLTPGTSSLYSLTVEDGGRLTVSGPQLTVSSGTGGGIYNYGTLAMIGGTLGIGGDSGNKVLFSTSPLQIFSIFTYAGSTVTLQSDINIGYMGVTGGSTLDANNRQINVSYNWQQDGTFIAGVSTVTFNSPGFGQFINGSVPVCNFANFAVNSSSTVIPTKPLDINGNFTIQIGTFNAGAYEHTIAGNFNQMDGIFNAGISTMTFDGIGTQIISSLISPVTFYCLMHTGIGSLTLGANLDINGNFTHSAGTVNCGSYQYNLAGRMSLNAWNAGNSTWVFDGTSAQTIPSGFGFYNIIVDNSIGLSYTGTGSRQIQNNLDIKPGAKLDITNNDIEVWSNLTSSGTFITAGSTVTFGSNNDSILYVNTGTTFGNIRLNKLSNKTVSIFSNASTIGGWLEISTGTLNMLSSSSTVQGATTISGSNAKLDIGSSTTTLVGAVNVLNGGTLLLPSSNPASVLKLGGNLLTVDTGGFFISQSSNNMITSTNPGSVFYTLRCFVSTVNVTGITLQSAGDNIDVLFISSNTKIVNLNYIVYKDPMSAINRALSLDYTIIPGTFTFIGHQFGSTVFTNIYAPNLVSGVVVMQNATGAKAGSDYEAEPNDRVFWPGNDSIAGVGPGAGESFLIGTSTKIVWTTYGSIKNFTIKYSTNNFTTDNFVANVSSPSINFDWTIPNNISTNVKVQVYATNYPIINSISPSTFRIVPSVNAASNLKISSLGTTSIQWQFTDNANDETELYVSSGTNDVTKRLSENLGPITGTGGTTSWLEIELSTNTVYTRYVESRSIVGSSWSLVSITSYTASAAPLNLTFTNVGSSSATLTWSTNTNPNWTRYGVILSSSTDFYGTSVSTTVAYAENLTANTTTLLSLSPETEYYFRVIAFNGDKIQTTYIQSSTTTKPSAEPAAPINLKVSALLGPTSIYWQFDDNSTNETGLYLSSGTNVTMRLSTNLANTVTKGTTYWLELGLSTNTKYTRYVEAENAYGSSWSSSISSYTLTSVPSKLTIIGRSSYTIVLDWQPNGNPEPGTNYWISRSTFNSFQEEINGIYSTSTAILSDLLPYVTYYFKVRSENGDSVMNYGYETPISTRTMAGSVNSIGISGYVGNALSTASIQWSWTDTNSGQNSEDGYYIRRAADNAILVSLPTDTITWTQKGLSANISTGTYIEVYNESGSAFSSSQFKYTLANTPLNISVNNIGQSSVTIQWGINNNPTNNTIYAVAQSTCPEFVGVTVSTFVKYADNLINNTTIAFNLTPETTYYFRVWAYNGSAIETAYSQTSSAIVTLIGPPVPPSNLKTVSLGPTSIQWQFDDNSTNETGLYLSSGTNDITMRLSPNLANTAFTGTTYWLELGLSTNTAYTRYTESVNSAGSSWSSVSITSYTAAVSPLNLTFTNVYSSSATLTWFANTNPNGTKYGVILSSNPECYGATVSTAVTFANNLINNTITVSLLSPETEYYFRVIAFNGDQIQTSYVQSSTTTKPSAAPTAPSNLKVSALLGTTSIYWQFDDNSTNEIGLYISSSKDIAARLSPNLANTTFTGTTYWLEVGLSTNTAYTRFAEAVNASGSSWSSVSITSYTATASPGSPYVTMISSYAIYLNWLHNNNNVDTVYNIEKSTDNVNFVLGNTISSTFDPVTSELYGLKPGTIYYVRVNAKNGDNIYSDYSSVISTETLPAAAPTDTTPPVVTITQPANGSYKASPTLVEGTFSDNVAVSSVVVSIRRIADGLYWNNINDYTLSETWYGCALWTSSWTYANISGSDGSGVTIVAKAKDSSNNWTIAYATNTFAFDTVAPQSSVTLPNNGSSYIDLPTISGTASDTVSGVASVDITIRDLTYSSSYWTGAIWTDTLYLITTTLSAGASVWTYTGVPSWRVNNEYKIESRAWDIVSHIQSPVASATFYIMITEPNQPTDLTATGVSNSSIKWVWTDKATNEDGYRVKTSTGVILKDALSVDATSWVETNLSPNIQYSRCVEVYNLGGSSTSVIISKYTLASLPSNFAFSAKDFNWIGLSWGENGNSPDTKYEIYRSSSNLASDFLLIASTVSVSFTDTGLTQSTTYYYRLYSVNGENIKTGPTEIIIQTPDSIVKGPISGKVTQANGQSITGVLVQLYNNSGIAKLFETFTKTDGSYLFENMDDGVYRVVSSWMVDDIESGVYKADIPENSTDILFTLEIQYQLAQLVGKITLGSRASFAGKFAPSQQPYVELLQRSRVIAKINTDSNGNYIIPNLLPGKYLARAFNGIQMSELSELKVREGEKLIVNFKWALGLISNEVYAYPNPSKINKITIRYAVPNTNHTAKIKIYNIAGELVREIKNNEITKTPPKYEFIWDLKNGDGSLISSGIYIYVLELEELDTGEKATVKKKLAIIK